MISSKVQRDAMNAQLSALGEKQGEEKLIAGGVSNEVSRHDTVLKLGVFLAKLLPCKALLKCNRLSREPLSNH